MTVYIFVLAYVSSTKLISWKEKTKEGSLSTNVLGTPKSGYSIEVYKNAGFVEIRDCELNKWILWKEQLLSGIRIIFHNCEIVYKAEVCIYINMRMIKSDTRILKIRGAYNGTNPSEQSDHHSDI